MGWTAHYVLKMYEGKMWNQATGCPAHNVVLCNLLAAAEENEHIV